MSEDEARNAGRIAGHEEETDETEAHLRRSNEEAGDEAEGDDDVEAHSRRAGEPESGRTDARPT
jgi:hypothetical protein